LVPANFSAASDPTAESHKKPSDSKPLLAAVTPPACPAKAAQAQSCLLGQKQPVAKSAKTRLAALEKEIAGKVCSASLDLLTHLRCMEKIMVGKEVTGLVVQHLESLGQLVGILEEQVCRTLWHMMKS